MLSQIVKPIAMPMWKQYGAMINISGVVATSHVCSRTRRHDEVRVHKNRNIQIVLTARFRTRHMRPLIESCSVGFGRLGIHISTTIAIDTGMHRIVKYVRTSSSNSRSLMPALPDELSPASGVLELGAKLIVIALPTSLCCQTS